MPRKSISVRNENKTREETYEGVPIAELMKEAGTPQGTQLRGRDLATYVLATGSDGYRALFSVAEVAPGFQDSEIIVADTLDGAPLSGKLGPLRLVVPHDQRLARWVRMLRSINVVRIPGPD